MRTTITNDSELVTVGRIVKPYGVRGEVRVHSLTDVPGRIEGLDRIFIAPLDGASLWTRVTSVRKIEQSYVLGLSAFSSPEEVGEFCGAWIQVPQGTVPALPLFQYYQFDLIGLEVRHISGRRLGTLEEILELPQHHVFVVRDDTNELLVPAVRRFVTDVDLINRVMTVDNFDQ